MLTEVMEHFSLLKEFPKAGYYETEHQKQMFCALNGTVCDASGNVKDERAIPSAPSLLQKLLSPLCVPSAGGKRSHAVRLIALFFFCQLWNFNSRRMHKLLSI